MKSNKKKPTQSTSYQELVITISGRKAGLLIHVLVFTSVGLSLFPHVPGMPQPSAGALPPAQSHIVSSLGAK
ncbi:hypothetical protein SAMN02745166_05003 [Prosthecobacter debontii]|uniref:Uncharacterized protein n=1 Tax=Prosthecobacter debontii TaxID=48467 RepID=A0A1T4Z3X7_9BACT|nr:hypothetical protein [Prosthecobacter debontii]SKB08714.1 hypothetical protein SAMN02745166_05003 [Prosthecobacter debontii]